MDVGQCIGSYQLEERVGDGATSAVFRARHLELGSMHAVKVLERPEQCLRERFLAEARVLGSVRHPYIVGIQDLITECGRLAIVLDFVDGPELDRWRVLHVPAVEARMRIVRDVLVALSALHRKGIVHRDVKPQNVLVTQGPEGWRPVLVDLGIAREADGSGTRHGTRMGTPWYMAPEQMLDAAGVDARADLYALGVVAYEMFADRRPFDDHADWEEALHLRRSRAYTPLVEFGLEPELSAWVDGLLAPLPDDRPHSAEAALGMLPDRLRTASPTLVPRAATVLVTPAAARLRRPVAGMAFAGIAVLGVGLLAGSALPYASGYSSPEVAPVVVQCGAESAPASSPSARARAGTPPATDEASPPAADKKRIRLPGFLRKNR